MLLCYYHDLLHAWVCVCIAPSDEWRVLSVEAAQIHSNDKRNRHSMLATVVHGVLRALLQVADISKTEQDGLAKSVRIRLRKRGIRNVKCVFSPENPVKSSVFEVPKSQAGKYKRSYYGTMSYMPAVFGMHAAAYVIRRVVHKRTAHAIDPLLSTERRPSEMNNSELEGYLYVI